MWSADEIEIVILQELVQHIRPEEIANASLPILVPSFLVLDWVRPKQVAEHALTGYLGGSIEC